MLVDKDDTLFHGVVNPNGLLHNSESSPPFGQNSLTGPLQNCFLALMESVVNVLFQFIRRDG